MNKNKKKVTNIQNINPVDYFNFNKIQYVFDFMLTIKNVEKTSINSFTYIKNKSDRVKKMIVIENDYFVAKEKNGLNLDVDKKYSPFMLLQRFKFKNNFTMTLNFVIHNIMNNDINYIRVGTDYFKKTIKVDRNGIKRRELKVWKKQTISDDHGKQIFDEIQKFDDFTLEPNNRDYKPIINNNYNLYVPFEHKPCNPSVYLDSSQWEWTKKLFKHIFGDQYELGIKYIKVMYDLPKQKLPILVLTSEERSTGKTTFADYLELLFGGNSVIINPENISNQFNGAYADKNVIIIEESRFESVQATEKLKNLATQKKILVNTKFIQHYSLPFHGKVIITSNDENKFSKVDDPEIRYWVRKIPSLKGKANHNILYDLKEEIPYFLHYINTLEEIDTTKSRMVFEAEEIITEALKKVKSESLPGLHKDILIYLDDHAMNNTEHESFMFTAKDLKNNFFKFNSKVDVNYINKIVKDSMKLKKSEKPTRYIPLISSINLADTKITGRPYLFKNEYYGEK